MNNIKYSNYDLATVRVLINATFPYLENRKYKVWVNHPNILMLQCYEGKEFYGHEYVVDLEQKTLTPKI